MEKSYRAYFVNSEYKHHVYTKTSTFHYAFHELGDETSLLGIAVMLPELLLSIQQNVDILDHVSLLYDQYVFDWVHIRIDGRLLKCVNHPFLSKFSYNAR